MNEIESLKQEIDQYKTRLADIEFFVNGILRDKNEIDKVHIQAEEILTICSRVGEMRSQYLHKELRKLRQEVSEQSDIINAYKEVVK